MFIYGDFHFIAYNLNQSTFKVIPSYQSFQAPFDLLNQMTFVNSGHSMGGMLAVSLVIRNPAFFKGMVLEVSQTFSRAQYILSKIHSGAAHSSGSSTGYPGETAPWKGSLQVRAE